MVNTQLLHVHVHVPNVHTKYCKYFCGFLNSRLLSFARNSRKLMYREYYHVYSITIYYLLHSYTQLHMYHINQIRERSNDFKNNYLCREYSEVIYMLLKNNPLQKIYIFKLISSKKITRFSHIHSKNLCIFHLSIFFNSNVPRAIIMKLKN